MHSNKMILFVIFVLLMVFVVAIPLSAQTATPVPTTVPTVTMGFSLDVNTAANNMFGSTNTFMGVFSPIYGIGAGIGIATAILGLISYVIIKSFSRGGK